MKNQIHPQKRKDKTKKGEKKRFDVHVISLSCWHWFPLYYSLSPHLLAPLHYFPAYTHNSYFYKLPIFAIVKFLLPINIKSTMWLNKLFLLHTHEEKTQKEIKKRKHHKKWKKKPRKKNTRKNTKANQEIKKKTMNQEKRGQTERGRKQESEGENGEWES